MKWSYRLLRVARIDIRVHVTFLLVLLWGAAQYGTEYGSRGAVFGVCLVLALFACVTLHELGHSLVAQRFGATVREIVLLPIGGMARLSREPKRPLHELLVAIAGPLVNVVIAVLLFFLLGLDARFAFDPHYWGEFLSSLEPPQLGAFWVYLLVYNVSLAVFNLVPAFPMDGGRVLRALLTFGIGKARATAVATRVGQILAVALMIVAVFDFNQPLLALIGLFVLLSATQEQLFGRAGEVLEDLTAGDVCDPNAVVLGPGDDVGDVVDQALRTSQALFPVVYGSELIGVVVRDEALRAATEVGLRTSVREILRRDLPTADARTPILEVRAHIADTGLPVVITDERRFVGVIGGEDMSRIIALGARLAAAGIRRPKAVPIPSEVSASRSPPAADG